MHNKETQHRKPTSLKQMDLKAMDTNKLHLMWSSEEQIIA